VASRTDQREDEHRILRSFYRGAGQRARVQLHCRRCKRGAQSQSPRVDRKVGPEMNAAHLAGWVPVQVRWQQASPVVDWCYLGSRRFTEPFFEQTIHSCMGLPFNLLFQHQTSIEMLAEL